MKVLALTREQFYDEIYVGLLREFIEYVYGPESTYYAKTWEPSDAFLNQYENLVANNLQDIKGKTVIDIGCNSGIWMLICLLQGVGKVIGIEPRKFFCNRFNEFITAIGYTNAVMYNASDIDFDTVLEDKPVDTALLSQVIYRCYDFPKLPHRLKNIGVTSIYTQDFYLSLQDLQIDSNLIENITGITLHSRHENNSYESGINRWNPQLNDKGFQTGYAENYSPLATTCFANYYSKEYVEDIMLDADFKLCNLVRPTEQISGSTSWNKGRTVYYSFKRKGG